jgi:hypothetical protein
VTDLNPPDRLAEIKRHSTRYGFIDDDQSWLIGEVERLLEELVETRTLLDAAQPSDPFPRLADRCPACGGTTLFVGSGGWITCSLIGCPDPTMDHAATIEALRAERDVERARADQLQADLDARQVVLDQNAAYYAELVVLREHVTRQQPVIDAAKAWDSARRNCNSPDPRIANYPQATDALVLAVEALTGSVDTPPPADRLRRRCPITCGCICHETLGGQAHDHPGEPCPGKRVEPPTPEPQPYRMHASGWIAATAPVPPQENPT